MSDLETVIGERLEKAMTTGALPLDLLLLTGIYYELVRARHDRETVIEVNISDEPTPPTPRRGRPRKTT